MNTRLQTRANIRDSLEVRARHYECAPEREVPESDHLAIEQILPHIEIFLLIGVAAFIGFLVLGLRWFGL